jgi:hypothetical protein
MTDVSHQAESATHPPVDDRHVYGEVDNKTDLVKIFQAI